MLIFPSVANKLMHMLLFPLQFNARNETKAQFLDLPARFGPPFPDEGLFVSSFLCSFIVLNLVRVLYTSYNYFRLIQSIKLPSNGEHSLFLMSQGDIRGISQDNMYVSSKRHLYKPFFRL